MSKNDTIISPYIINPGLQKPVEFFVWKQDTFNFPLLNFNNAGDNKTVSQQKLQNFQGNKTIGEYLNKKYVCEPDVLRVAKPVLPYNVPKMPEIKYDIKMPDIPVNYNLNFDVIQNLYNGSAADLNKCLKGTKLEGKGQMFLDAQTKYGINAIFLMSITKTESQYGQAPAREGNGTVHKYNIAGLKTGKRTRGHIYQDNESYEACIESLCKNLHKHYISKGKTTIGTIQKIYAPGNTNWAVKIKNAMGDISEEIIESYTKTESAAKQVK